MPPEQITPKLLNWASSLEEEVVEQADRTSRMPFVSGHVALMPDAHFGKGSTVGSVIPTKGAIIPAAIGVDIGCGMIASKLNITASLLPDSLDFILPLISEKIPGGMGKTNDWNNNINVREAIGFSPGVEGWHLEGKAISQMGTLGGGNHFIEICLDENEDVWVVLHSGSRGVGNVLATRHIDKAQKLMRQYFIQLEDPDLAYLVEGTDQFKAYIDDMLWAQDYAALNRDVMMNNMLTIINSCVRDGIEEIERINCHHNFTQRENHHGRNLWITRKGAIKAGSDDMGIIPGSMGTSSFIVQGSGNPASYNSCSHGAGRKMSRGRAKRELSLDSLQSAMQGKSWLSNKDKELLDEHPDSYKDIHQVMRDQEDLVTIRHTLNQILNYKGTN